MKSTVLITGCSSGFGKATAALFLARGWNVIATMRSPKSGLFEAHDCLLIAPLDVTQPASVSDAIAAGIGRFGQIDVFVNNAGIGMFGAHEAVSDDVVRQVFETNTFGVMAANRAIIPTCANAARERSSTSPQASGSRPCRWLPRMPRASMPSRAFRNRSRMSSGYSASG